MTYDTSECYVRNLVFFSSRPMRPLNATTSSFPHNFTSQRGLIRANSPVCLKYLRLVFFLFDCAFRDRRLPLTCRLSHQSPVAFPLKLCRLMNSNDDSLQIVSRSSVKRR